MLKLKLLLITSLTTQLVACFNGDSSEEAEEAINPWWTIVTPVTIGNDRYYGKPCSVTRVRDNIATIIFEAPSKLLTPCSSGIAYRNYLKYNGKHITLHVDRQTFGAGAKTHERFRASVGNLSKQSVWEEYIGITWVNGEEYEAWRKVGSTSRTADSRTKVEH